METNIENAEMAEIRQLLEERGVMEGFAKMSRKKLIKVLNTDLYCSGAGETVNAHTTLADAKNIPHCEFTKWCRIRSIGEETILKLVENDIINVQGLGYLRSEAVDAFNVSVGQRELLKGLLEKEFGPKQSNGSRDDFPRTHYKMEAQKGPKLELWDDSKISFLDWLEGIEWRLEASDPERENWKQTIMSLLTGEARENARDIKKISDTLTYDSFRQLLVAKMIDESAKARINIEIAKMKYNKDIDVDEYVKKMVMLLKAKTPGAREDTICEWIIDKLPEWAQYGIQVCGRNNNIKELKLHLWSTNKIQQKREEELEELRKEWIQEEYSQDLTTKGENRQTNLVIKIENELSEKKTTKLRKRVSRRHLNRYALSVKSRVTMREIVQKKGSQKIKRRLLKIKLSKVLDY